MSGHVMTDVVREYAIDECLVPHAPAFRFLPEASEDGRIQPNRNQLTRLVTEQRTADAAHRPQLLAGGLRYVREINLSRCPRTQTFPGGSPAAR